MKKAISILLTALLLLTVFVSCEGDVEDLFGDNITITFNGNGSTSGQMAALKVARGKEVRLTANTYEKTDSEFTGWNTKAGGSGYAYEDEQFVNFEEDTTLYAQWDIVYETITFDANDGSGSMDPQVVPKGIPTKLNAIGTHITKDGEEFIGWNTKADGTGVLYKDEATVTLSEDLTLYAWFTTTVELDESMTAWQNGYRYVANSSFSIDDRITVTGIVKLDLKTEGKTLTAVKGITVSNGNTLVISGPGSLTATGASNAAGIGGIDEDDKNTAGTIIINGGVITVNGGLNSAAIGGSIQGNGGTIEINGGTVIATGGYGGAGIGGGYSGSGGNIAITGGTVTATGGFYGAGIGGGQNQAGGIITINGGTVTAKGGTISAGIGGGYSGSGGKVTIAGGTVTATGNGGAAGIGGGVSEDDGGDGADVTISGGSVTATGGGSNGLGIGGGYGQHNRGDDNNLTLTGITMEVSTDNTSWTDYKGTRKQYMRTKTN